jgi:hypothetical protein
MPGFTVDPDSLPPLAARLRHAGDELQSSWEPVARQSQSVRFGRGDDVLSPLIQVSLEGAVSLVDSCIPSSVAALAGYADGLEAMGRTYAGAEQGTTAIMRAE